MNWVMASYAIGYVFLFGISADITLSMLAGGGHLCHGKAKSKYVYGVVLFFGI